MKSFSFWFFMAPFYHILSGYFRISVLALFRVALDTIERMERFGVFKVAEILKQEIDERSFGETLLRGIRWFSNAQIQVVKVNQYLNLTSCMETLLTPAHTNATTSTHISYHSTL